MRRGIGFVAAGLCTVLLAAPAPAKVDKDEVNKAVDRGVKYLKGLQRGDGTWPYDQIGATALAGLTLLECGVATDDPAVQKAARAVRHKSVGLTHTYSLALSIMFLDRLGERVDVSLIESMAVRLLAGQYASGGWSYDCPNIGEAEVRRLGKMVELRNDRIEKGEPPQLMPPGRREFKELPKEIQQQIMAVSKQRGGFGGNGGGVGTSTETIPIPSSPSWHFGWPGATAFLSRRPWDGSRRASAPRKTPMAAGATCTLSGACGECP